jgi:hypothetical protein
MNQELRILKAGLKQFGLNPEDWVLEAKTTLGGLTRFELWRPQDGLVMFEGWADRRRWLTLGITRAIF